MMGGLLDFIQGASNAAASNVAGPVDLINAGLLGIGLPMPAAPFGGTQWMRDKGLIRDPQNRMAGLLGEAAGMSLPIVAAAKAPQIARGLLDHAEAYRKYHAATTAPGAPATVWHGSPHKFDRFDASKIGTGEGAQSYGHGLYLADSQKVASGYRARLSDLIDGAGVPQSGGDIWARATSAAQRAGAKHPDHAGAIARQIRDWVDAGKKPETYLRFNQVDDSLVPAYQAAIGEFSGVKKHPGHLYKVDLPDDAIARMLDWDAPLSAQPESVRKALSPVVNRQKAFTADPRWGDIGDPAKFESLTNGGDLYKSLKDLDADTLRALAKYGETMNAGSMYTMLGLDDKIGSRAGTSEALRRIGIPGIRYLDGGSRGAGTGTRNYVVFPGNEGLLTILSRE